MFSHVMVGSNNIERSKIFYDAVLATIGVGQPISNKNGTGQNRLFYREDGGAFCVTEPLDGQAATAGNGSTVGFRCQSSQQVDSFHEVAVANGGTSIEDPPGLRQSSMGDMYLAYVRDPDGNKLCAGFWPKK